VPMQDVVVTVKEKTENADGQWRKKWAGTFAKCFVACVVNEEESKNSVDEAKARSKKTTKIAWVDFELLARVLRSTLLVDITMTFAC
jgi:hypothetical protein